MSTDHLADAALLQQQIFIAAERIRWATSALCEHRVPDEDTFYIRYVQEVVSSSITAASTNDLVLGRSPGQLEDVVQYQTPKFVIPLAIYCVERIGGPQQVDEQPGHSRFWTCDRICRVGSREAFTCSREYGYWHSGTKQLVVDQ